LAAEGMASAAVRCWADPLLFPRGGNWVGGRGLAEGRADLARWRRRARWAALACGGANVRGVANSSDGHTLILPAGV